MFTGNHFFPMPGMITNEGYIVFHSREETIQFLSSISFLYRSNQYQYVKDVFVPNYALLGYQPWPDESIEYSTRKIRGQELYAIHLRIQRGPSVEHSYLYYETAQQMWQRSEGIRLFQRAHPPRTRRSMMW